MTVQPRPQPPAPLAPGALVRRAETVAERIGPDRITVLALDSPRCNPFELAGGGVEVWLRLDDALREVSALVAEIATDHDRGEAEIDHPVRAFLAELHENGLIEVAVRP